VVTANVTGYSSALACREFRLLVKKELSFLIVEYGCRVTAERSLEQDCGVEFRNATTAIAVLREVGSPPWVQISRVSVVAPGRDVARSSLDFVAMVIGRPVPDASRTTDRGGLINWLRAEAEILVAASMILKGDFEILQKTGPLMESWEKELNKRYFGSETGETPDDK